MSPLGAADVPGFLPQRAAARAVINSLWGTGEMCLLWIQKGTEEAAKE